MAGVALAVAVPASCLPDEPAVPPALRSLLGPVTMQGEPPEQPPLTVVADPGFGSGPPVAPAYVRVGQTIELQVAQLQDLDTVVDEFGMPVGWIQPSLQLVRYSDGGAGGQFGRLVDEHFQEETDHALVTHYKAPDTPQGLIEIVGVYQDREDEVHHFWYMGFEYSLTPADDGEGTTTPWKLTAWDLTLTECPPAWRPLYNTALEFTAELQPAVDFAGQPIERTIEFRLEPVSAMLGVCGNWAIAATDWRDTATGGQNDLKFTWAQAGFTLDVSPGNTSATNYDIASTTGPKRVATVEVTCLDYGAYGDLRASVNDGSLGPELRARRASSPVGAEKYYVSIPIDNIGGEEPWPANHIADNWRFGDTGPERGRGRRAWPGSDTPVPRRLPDQIRGV